MGGLISGIGSIYSGISGLVQGQQAANQEWTTNSALDQYGARAAMLQGNQAANRARMQGSQMVAAQRVGYANSGIDEKSGTAASVQADTAAQGELDAQTIQNNAARQAWGFKLAQEQSHQQYLAKTNSLITGAAGQIFAGAGQMAGGAGSLFGG